MALPKYMTGQPEKTKRKKSQSQEKRVAAAIAGKVQPGSGSRPFKKGDIKSTEMLVEAKRTDKDSMSVKKAWLVKVFRESVGYNRIPALSLEFDDMPDLVPKDWIAIPAKTLALLFEYYKYVESEDDDDE